MEKMEKIEKLDQSPRHRGSERRAGSERGSCDAASFDLVIELDEEETQGEVSAGCGCRLERTEFSVGLSFCDFHRQASLMRAAYLNEESGEWWSAKQRIGEFAVSPTQPAQAIFLLWHFSTEPYDRQRPSIGMSGVELCEAGVREFVQIHVCGERTAQAAQLSDNESMPEQPERQFLAGIWSWFYPREQTLLLQDVELFSAGQQINPQQHEFFVWLWSAVERELLARFPACQRIVTPGRDPKYPTRAYQAFLTQQGYVAQKDETFLKVIVPDAGQTLTSS